MEKKYHGYIKGIKEIKDDVIIYENSGKLGVKKLDGKELLKPEYEEIKKISTNTYIVKKEKYNVLKVEEGTDNVNITELIENGRDTLEYYKDGAFYIATTKNEGYIRVQKKDLKTEAFYNFKFEEILEEQAYKTNNLFRFTENGKVGFKNSKGVVIVPAIYDDATYQNIYGYIAVNRSGKWGSLDYNGKVIVEPKYDLKDYTYIDFIKDMYRYKDADIVAYVKE